MDKTINYLKSIFGEELRIDNRDFYNKLPMYMWERYYFDLIELPYDLQSYVLVKPIGKQDIVINRLKKQMEQIHRYLNSLPVFIFDHLRLSQRNALIKNQIPFIQPEVQIYIPAVMINLTQRECVEKEYAAEFSIAAQVVYIYILLNDIKVTNAPRLAVEIPYSKITLNRALAELVDRGLIYTEGNNTRKTYKAIGKAELWEKGKKCLFNPVEKVFYTDHQLNNGGLFISGETALSRLGISLNVPDTWFYAASSKTIKNMDKRCFLKKYDIVTDDYFVVEQFKYDPGFLSKSHYIDVISLYAQLKNSDDERIQIALEELLGEELA